MAIQRYLKQPPGRVVVEDLAFVEDSLQGTVLGTVLGTVVWALQDVLVLHGQVPAGNRDMVPPDRPVVLQAAEGTEPGLL